MCGIAGYAGRLRGSTSVPNLDRALDELAHRGPDGAGKYETVVSRGHSIPSSLVAMGHRRLAILDLSERGTQPFIDDKGRVLVFNGEIFNWRDLRSELQVAGYRFSSHSDTEVLLAGYDKWGLDVLPRLNGFWAFGLFDPTGPTGPQIVLSRDRLGIKPLYLARDDATIAFASEIRALLALLDRPAVVDAQRLVEQVTFQTVSVESSTIYQGIEEFPPASWARYDLMSGKSDTGRYWSTEKSDECITDERVALERFSDLVEDSVRLWLQADVPVGLTLSGGVDSSVIAVAATRSGARDLCAFTSSFPGTEFDETRYASALASRLNIRHVLVTPRLEEAISEMPRFAQHQETLFSSFSQLVAWLVFREIKKEGYKAFLSGQGGDELFLGYERYYVPNVLEAWRNPYELAKRATNAVLKSRLSATDLVGYLAYFAVPTLRRYRLLHRARELLPLDILDLASRGKPTPLPSRSMGIQTGEVLESHQLRRLLRFDDRSSSAFGLEGRPVLLDHRLVEFAFALHPSLLLKDGWTKYLLRRYLDAHGHGDVAWRRHKLGFPAPNEVWAAEWLRERKRKNKEASPLAKVFRRNLDVQSLSAHGQLMMAIVDLTSEAMPWASISVPEWKG